MSEQEPKSCEWIDREPQYIKSIGGMRIDKSEWEGDKGAFFRYKEIPCRLAVDAGHRFCPKHELLYSAQIEPQGRA